MRAGTQRARLWICAFAAAWVCLAAPPAGSECVHPQGNVQLGATANLYGDVNDNGKVNVADALCGIFTSLWALDPQGEPPLCLGEPPDLVRADPNCDGVPTVEDVTIVIYLSVSLPLPEAIDADGDQCDDACAGCVPPSESSCLIGGACLPEGFNSVEDPCMGCVPSVDTAGYSPLDDGAPCGEGMECLAGECIEVESGSPTNVFAIAGPQQAIVTWTAPPPTGDTPQSYLVSVYAADGGPPLGVSGPTERDTYSPANDYTFMGLTNGTPYRFRVALITSAGVGPQSALSNPVTPVGPPGAPKSVVATPGNTSAVVSFLPPTSSGGSPITSYLVTIYPTLDTVSVTASPVLVQGLLNGTAYWFTVTASNAAGSGPPSAASNAVVPVGLPGAPAIVSAIGQDRQIFIGFAAPAQTGGSTNLVYEATCTPVGGGASASAESTTLEVIVTGLVNGTAYTCTVTASNEAGDGPPSAPSSEVTPQTVEQPPGVVVAAPVSVYRADQYDSAAAPRQTGVVAAAPAVFTAGAFDSALGASFSGAVVAAAVSTYAATQYDSGGVYATERTGAVFAPPAVFAAGAFDSALGASFSGAVAAAAVSTYAAIQYDSGGVYAQPLVGAIFAPPAVLAAGAFDSALGASFSGAIVAPAVSTYADDQYDSGGVYDPQRAGVVLAAPAVFAAGLFDSGLGASSSGAVVAPAVSTYAADQYDSGGSYDTAQVGAIVAGPAVLAAGSFDSGLGASKTGAVVAWPTATVGRPYVYDVAPASFSRLDPSGMVSLTLVGIGFAPVVEVRLYEPSGLLSSLAVADPPVVAPDGTSLVVVVTVSPSAPTGTWTAAVVTGSSISSPTAPPGSQLGFDNTFIVTN